MLGELVGREVTGESVGEDVTSDDTGDLEGTSVACINDYTSENKMNEIGVTTTYHGAFIV